MKSTVVPHAVYVKTHGLPERGGAAASPEIRSLWAKLQKLQPMNGNSGEFVIVEKTDADEDLRRVRDRVYSGLRGYLRRSSPRTFAVRMRLRRDEGHVLLWRELLPPQSPATIADHVEQPAKPEATDQPSLPLPRDKREKVRPAPLPHVVAETPRVAAMAR
jgi:hypothetical protein